MIHIIVVAKGIDDDVVNRFSDSVVNSNPNNKYKLNILGRDDTSKRFYKTRLLNAAIREFSGNPEDVIIQTDIDVLVPKFLIDYTYEKAMSGIMIHNEIRYIDKETVENINYNEYSFDEWKKQPTQFCSGCWNGMTVANWIKSKGYNELMSEWGAEDTEFYQRASRLGIPFVSCKEYPLVHVGHARRTTKRPNENMVFADKYPNHNWLSDGIPEGEE